MIILLFASTAAAIEIPFQIVAGPSVNILDSAGVSAASSTLKVHPGETITVAASVSFKYLNQSGMPASFTTPPFPTHVHMRLYKDGNELSSLYQLQDYQADSITIRKDETKSASGNVYYHLPLDLEPGLYVMRISATAEPAYLGISYPKTAGPYVFLINVVSTSVASATPTSMASPTPTPVPQNGSVKNFTVTNTTAHRAGNGNMTFATDNATFNKTDGSQVAGSVNVDLGTALPAKGGNMTIRMVDQPTTTASTQFLLASAKTGMDISDIACVMIVDHPDMANGKEIKNATITMKVSGAWVDAHGGVSNVKIMRYSNGVTEVLNTTYQGTDSDGLLVFTAVSPHGLSEFALVAMTAPVVLPEKVKTTGPQVSAGFITGAIAALVILLAIVTGGVYVVLQKKKKK